MRTYRGWTLEQKRQAVERMATCRHAKLAAEIGIPQRQLYSWRKDLQPKSSSREKMLEGENQRLKEALATKVVEADFLQGVLRRIEAQRRPSSGSGETASTRRSE